MQKCDQTHRYWAAPVFDLCHDGLNSMRNLDTVVRVEHKLTKTSAAPSRGRGGGGGRGGGRRGRGREGGKGREEGKGEKEGREGEHSVIL